MRVSVAYTLLVVRMSCFVCDMHVSLQLDIISTLSFCELHMVHASHLPKVITCKWQTARQKIQTALLCYCLMYENVVRCLNYEDRVVTYRVNCSNGVEHSPLNGNLCGWCRFTYLKGLVAISAPWEGSITALKGMAATVCNTSMTARTAVIRLQYRYRA